MVEIDYSQLKDIEYREPILVPRQSLHWADWCPPQRGNVFADAVRPAPVKAVVLYNATLLALITTQELEIGDEIIFDLSKLVAYGEGEETFIVDSKYKPLYKPAYPGGTFYDLTFTQWQETPVYLYGVLEA